jgi:hypothetical protein
LLKDGLAIVKDEPEPGRDFGRFEVDGHHFSSFLLGEVQFSPAVLGSDGVGSDKIEYFRAALNGPRKLIRPLMTRTDALVIPDVDTVVVEPRNLAENELRVLVPIAHEDIRLITPIS